MGKSSKMARDRKRIALAEALSWAHQKSNLTLEQVGTQIDREPNSVHAYLTGRNEPPALVLFELARVYGASLGEWAAHVQARAQPRRRSAPADKALEAAS